MANNPLPSGRFYFSEDATKRIAKATRRVEGTPYSLTGPGGTGAVYAPLDVWLVLTDWDGSPNENHYTVTAYAQPYGGTALASGVPAWNMAEYGNSSGSQCGYTIVTSDPICGDVTGIEDLPTTRRYRALAYVYRNDSIAAGVWGYVFDARPDPTINDECDEEV